MADKSLSGGKDNTRPVFVIVDGYSLLFRAFFATPNLRTSDGRPTNALYGFANMILRLLDEYRPTAAAIAWDAPAATFRHESFTDYKAHRPATPDDLSAQVGPLLEMIQALRIPLVEARGFEADDVLGTLACRASTEGYRVYIVSGDTDMMQLVDENVSVVTSQRGVSETTEYGPDEVRERYGVRPDQVVDFKALKGDASDNIPGVSGIGEKTATRLIAEFGDLDALYARLDEVKPERTRRLLEEGRASAYLSRDLSRIACDVNLDVSPADCTVREPDARVARDFFSRWQMRSLETRFAALAEEAAPAPALVAHETDYVVLESEDAVRAFAATVRPGCLGLALDHAPFTGLETISGVALSSCEDRGVYVPIAHDIPGQLEMHDGLPVAALEPVWEAAGHRVAGHHLKPALKALRAAGAGDLVPEFDAALAGYMLDSTRSDYRLADLSGQFLGRQARHAFVKLDRKTLESDEARRLRLVEEADFSLALLQPMTAAMDEAGVLEAYRRTDLPLVPLLAEMERTGIRVDSDALAHLSREFDEAIQRVRQAVFDEAGEEFNIGSTKQLQAILFDKMGLKATKKTKTGYSTDSAVLEQLAAEIASHGAESNIVQNILDYRELTKLKATYTDALLALRNPEDGRVHTTFNQTVAATGRLSSSEPNLQNIPIRTEIGQQIRRCFVPAPDHVLLSADYSQIELRVLAHVTGEEELVRAFRDDEDIHALTASRIFDVPLEEVTPGQRRDAKTVNFAVLYGQSDFGLSAQLKIPRREAKAYIEAYFARFPRVRAYIEATLEEARNTGYVRTLIGRRRPVPEVRDRNHAVRSFGERAAVNSPIQGTAADIMKVAMIAVREEMRAMGDPATLLLQVHDELVLEAPPEHLKPVAEAVRTTMETAYPLNVRLRVDVKYGENWQDMVRFDT